MALYVTGISTPDLHVEFPPRPGTLTGDEGLNRIARMQLNSDAAAVVNGMTDSELARLAHNIEVVLEEREIAHLIEAQPFRSHPAVFDKPNLVRSPGAQDPDA